VIGGRTSPGKIVALTRRPPASPCDTCKMADEDEEFLLRHEAAEELKRLATHPIKEIERLEEEAREGKTAASLGLVLAGVGLGVWAIAAVLLAFVTLAVWIFVR
jgi:hypothetical protein